MANRPVQGGRLSPFRELYREGVRLFHIDATFSEDIFHPELRAWKEPGRFDYSAQEEYWKTLIAACPEARFCLRLYAASPPWWDDVHPAELQRYADGGVRARFQRSDRETLPSLASMRWRADAEAALSQFLDWLQSSGWSERIWGLFLTYGITWEWGILGSDRFPDSSEPMRRQFREWLREFYRTEDRLRECWGDQTITFETAEIPSLEQRLAGRELREFPRDRAAFDFQNCLSDTNCDYLLALGRCVRRAAGDTYKLGTFYGYTLTAREHTPFTAQYGPGGLAGGHHAFGRFLRSGVFDFNASPYAYANRDLGSGCLIQHFPRTSCQRHGLRVYDENDLRPFLVAGQPDDRTISIGQTKTLEESLRHQRWAHAQALCHGTSYWWTELSDWIGPYAPYFDHPDILRELGHHHERFQEYHTEALPEPAEIALILDERSIAALALDSKLLKRELYDQLAAWSWCGAPFDVWLADDVSPETMARVRLAWVFSPFPDQDLRERLQNTLCRDRRTVWWAPYSGAITDHGLDPGRFQELTQFNNPACHDGLRRLVLPDWTSLYGSAADFSASNFSTIARDAGVTLFGTAPLHVMKGKTFAYIQRAQSRMTDPATVLESPWQPLPGWTTDDREALWINAEAICRDTPERRATGFCENFN